MSQKECALNPINLARIGALDDLEEVCDALCFYSAYLSDDILKRAIEYFSEISDEMAEKLENRLSEEL